jgi:hypothetical protein
MWDKHLSRLAELGVANANVSGMAAMLGKLYAEEDLGLNTEKEKDTPAFARALLVALPTRYGLAANPWRCFSDDDPPVRFIDAPACLPCAPVSDCLSFDGVCIFPPRRLSLVSCSHPSCDATLAECMSFDGVNCAWPARYEVDNCSAILNEVYRRQVQNRLSGTQDYVKLEPLTCHMRPSAWSFQAHWCVRSRDALLHDLRRRLQLGQDHNGNLNNETHNS